MLLPLVPPAKTCVCVCASVRECICKREGKGERDGEGGKDSPSDRAASRPTTQANPADRDKKDEETTSAFCCCLAVMVGVTLCVYMYV